MPILPDSSPKNTNESLQALMQDVYEPLPAVRGPAMYGEAEKVTFQRPLTLSLLLRFKFIIIVTFLVVAVPGIILIWFMTVPEYQVQAQVRVRPLIPRLVFRTDDNGLIPFYQSYLNTQVSVILSPTVLQRVIEQPEIQRTDWYHDKEMFTFGKPRSPMEKLKKKLMITPNGITELIDIAMTDPNAEQAALTVNAILDQYLRFIRENSTQTEDLIYKKLMEEYLSLRGEIESREGIAAKLRKELGTGTPEELITQRRIRIDALQAQLRDLGRRITTNDWQLKEMKFLVDKVNTKAKSPLQADNPRYEEDVEWRKLYLDYKTLYYQIDVEKDRLGDSHPTMMELRKRLKMADEMLKGRQAQLDDQFRAHPERMIGGGEAKSTMINEVFTLQKQNKLYKFQEQLLQEEIKKLLAEFDRAFETAQRLIKENEIIGYKRDLYTAVRNRIDQKEMERNVPGSIEVLARAVPSTEPYHDRRFLLTLMTLLGGIGGGLVLAFFRASTSQMIDQEEDLHRMVQTPFLGQLPLCRMERNIPVENNPEQSECIRMIRTALLQRIDGEHGNAIMVTSAGPKAGKTTVAVLLARSLTQCGKKILLVDADICNPSIPDRFKIDPGPGLLAALTQNADDAQTIIHTDIPGLCLLPSGIGWNLADQELLANGTFSECLGRWRDQYDIIIFDSPPILPVADARILARQMDGTILVIKEGHCRRLDITEALAYLGTAGGKLLGTIFIGSPRSGRSRYPYYGHSESPAAIEVKTFLE